MKLKLKSFLLTAIYIFTACIFFYGGYIYAIIKIEFETEKATMYDQHQMSIIHNYRNLPSCKDILNSSSNIFVYKDTHIIIVCKYAKDTNILSKVLIDDQLNLLTDTAQIKFEDNKCSIIDIGE